jgi:isopenicillin N synthase-like dioxygenase
LFAKVLRCLSCGWRTILALFRLLLSALTHPEPTNQPIIVSLQRIDYTGFTLLGVDGEPGLQVLVNGMWIDVPYVEHGFIVNAGDLIPVYTNGLWRSNVHRVLAPAMDSPAAHRSRFSTVFFTGPSKESVVEPIAACVSDTCPRAFDPVRAGDWLKMKLNASHTS